MPDLALTTNDEGARVDSDILEDWAADAMHVLGEHDQDDGEAAATARRPRQNRVAGFHFVKYLEHALSVVTGKGWLSWRPTYEDLDKTIAQPAADVIDVVEVEQQNGWLPDGDELTAVADPVLTLSSDQGAGWFQAQFFLIYAMKISIHQVSDESHRLWNDSKGATQQAGLMPFVRLHSLIMNLDYGPWEGSSFFQKMVLAKRALADNYDESFWIFQEFLPLLLRDWGQDRAVLDEEVSLSAWNDWKEASCWHTKAWIDKLCLGN